MQTLPKLQWLASFAAALRVCAVPQDTIDQVSEPMWEVAGLLDPEQAASEYTSMLVSANMQERRRRWRGWPSQTDDPSLPGSDDAGPSG